MEVVKEKIENGIPWISKKNIYGTLWVASQARCIVWLWVKGSTRFYMCVNTNYTKRGHKD